MTPLKEAILSLVHENILPSRYYNYGYLHGAYYGVVPDNALKNYYPEHLCYKAYYQGFTDGEGDRELHDALG